MAVCLEEARHHNHYTIRLTSNTGDLDECMWVQAYGKNRLSSKRERCSIEIFTVQTVLSHYIAERIWGNRRYFSPCFQVLFEYQSVCIPPLSRVETIVHFGLRTKISTMKNRLLVRGEAINDVHSNMEVATSALSLCTLLDSSST